MKVWNPIETIPSGVTVLIGAWCDGQWEVGVFKVEDPNWIETFEDAPTHWAWPPASPLMQDR